MLSSLVIPKFSTVFLSSSLSVFIEAHVPFAPLLIQYVNYFYLQMAC